MAERVIIYEGRIAGLFNPGASGDAFMRSFLRQTHTRALSTVPRRSNALAASHRTLGPVRRGRYGLRGQVVATAEHAAWVHDGTTGPIRPRSARYLRIPYQGQSMIYANPRRPSEFGNGAIYVRSVKGQESQPWLDNAGTFTARSFLAGGYIVSPIYL